VTAAAAADSGAPIAASVEQFDAQSPDAVLFGFDAGWHEDEYNPGTGARWRWASRRAELRIWNAGHAVRVRMAVESPLQTFEEAPIVILSAGSRELARVVPRDGFTLDVRVPAEALAAADGRLTLTTSQVFVPADNVGPADPRRNDRRALGLRVWRVAVARE
jgi:hypothetical protein